MQQYKNNPHNFIKLKKRILKRSIPVTFLSVIAGLAIFYFSNDISSMSLGIWAVYVIFIIGIMAYAILKAIKRQKELFNSYVLSIDGDKISRSQLGLITVNIFFNEIQEITIDKNNDLLIKGQSKDKRIAVSYFIENYEELLELLQVIKPIDKPVIKNLLQKYSIIFSIVALALMVMVYTNSNKTIVGISGVLIIILLGWSFYKTITSKLVDSKIKRNAWFMLIVLASVAAIIYKKVILGN